MSYLKHQQEYLVVSVAKGIVPAVKSVARLANVFQAEDASGDAGRKYGYTVFLQDLIPIKA